jgi:hypothetical protein
MADAENCRDLKTQKKIKIVFGGVELTGCCRKLAGSENPKKKIKILFGGAELTGCFRKLAGSENPPKK